MYFIYNVVQHAILAISDLCPNIIMYSNMHCWSIAPVVFQFVFSMHYSMINALRYFSHVLLADNGAINNFLIVFYVNEIIIYVAC